MVVVIAVFVAGVVVFLTYVVVAVFPVFVVAITTLLQFFIMVEFPTCFNTFPPTLISPPISLLCVSNSLDRDWRFFH